VSESRTVLPAPKLLNLIGIRATENAITLVAQTSSRVARCPVCRKRSARVHSRYARTLTDLPLQGVPVIPFACASEGSSAMRGPAVGRSSRSVYLALLLTTVAGPSVSTAGSGTSPLPSGVKRALAS